jgi:hypothetical protein
VLLRHQQLLQEKERLLQSQQLRIEAESTVQQLKWVHSRTLQQAAVDHTHQHTQHNSLPLPKKARKTPLLAQKLLVREL